MVQRNKIGPGQACISASEASPGPKYLSVLNSVFLAGSINWFHKKIGTPFSSTPTPGVLVFLGRIAWGCRISWGAKLPVTLVCFGRCPHQSVLNKIQGFAESLQHCIRPQSSVTSLYEGSELSAFHIRKLLRSEF